MDSGIYVLSSIGLASLIGYYSYINRIFLLENINFYYKQGDEYIKNLYPLRVIEVYNLDSKKIYLIKIMNKPFIVPETNINIQQYKNFKNSLVIPHSPEDILEASITTENEETIDITEVSKLLVGPLVDQFTQENKDWIYEYLEKKHNYKNIKVVKIMFINGNKIII